MSLTELLAIAVALSLDAFAAAVASGFSMRPLRKRDALKVALFFGGFQALMPSLGWLAGFGVRAYIAAVEHWIAFGLLFIIGAKMIYEALVLAKEERLKEPPSTLLLLGLAVATSIDALAVGLSLCALRVAILLPAAVIGVVCFALSLLGVWLGRRCGHLFESKIEAAGGLLLIAIGVKILVEHLAAGM
jgi:putative Mn2+ efflux pump MntP